MVKSVWSGFVWLMKELVLPLFAIVVVIPAVMLFAYIGAIFLLGGVYQWVGELSDLWIDGATFFTPCFVLICLGFWRGRWKTLPKSFGARYGWYFVAIFYILVAANVVLYISGSDVLNEQVQLIMMRALMPFAFIGFYIAILGNNFHAFLAIPICAYLLVALGVTLGAWSTGRQKVQATGAVALFVLTLVLFGAYVWQFNRYDDHLLLEEEAQAPTVYSERYLPIVLQTQGSLRMIEQRVLAADGRQLRPYYVWDGVYQERDGKTFWNRRYVREGIYNEYERLMTRSVDMVMMYAPSPEQQALAQEQGLTIDMVSVAKEALVFFVHVDNPVQSLTTEQIRAIYAGELSNWEALGGERIEIRAFQNSEESKGQEVMESMVMQGQRMQTPIQEVFSILFHDLRDFSEVKKGQSRYFVSLVADYRNTPAALGYSFRHFIKQALGRGEMRLLAVDGVEPTAENIRNGTYPFIVDVYMVTATSENRVVAENTQQMMNWFLSEEGQQLVEEVGYVPLVDSF